MKRMILALCVLIVCVSTLSACKEHSTPTPRDEMREQALTCFAEHKEDMEGMIAAQQVSGETKWCRYSKGSGGSYEFVLEQTGFTGTNTRAGIQYLPEDQPNSDMDWVQDGDVYTYQSGPDVYYAERIEKYWFFFYYEYDF